MFSYAANPGRWVSIAPSTPAAVDLCFYLVSIGMAKQFGRVFYIEPHRIPLIVSSLRHGTGAPHSPFPTAVMERLAEILEACGPLPGE